MSFKKYAVLVSASMLAFATYLSADTSGDKPVSNPPMFIVLGSDDNTSTEGMNWIVDYLASKRHAADGTKLRMSFYSNTPAWSSESDDIVVVHKKAYQDGHEVSAHTNTHLYCVNTAEKTWDGKDNPDFKHRASLDSIKNDVLVNIERLELAGVPREHMKGFRTPYLAFSDSTFQVIKELGFEYDCSVTESQGNPVAHRWPYTLDNGIISGSDQSWYITTYDAPVGFYQGVWELPSYSLQAHPDDWEYLKGQASWNTDGLVTGLDWNMWADPQGGVKFNKDQSLKAMKYTLDEKLKGSRAPMAFGMHSQYYVDSYDASGFEYMKNFQDRRDVIEDFIDYALTKDDVWFVSGAQVIAYMKSPVAASSFNPDSYAWEVGGGENVAPTNITLSKTSIEEGTTTVGSLSTVDANGGSFTYDLVSGSGFSIDGSTLKADASLSVGDHTVKIKSTDNGGLSIEKEFTVKVTAKAVSGDPVEVISLAKYYYAYHDSSDADCSSKYTDEKDGDKITKVIFDLTLGGGVYTSGEGAYPEQFTKVTDVEITYAATADFTVALPMSSITDGGVHSIVLSKDESSKKFSVSDLAQPSWAKTKKEFDGSEANALTFSLADGVASGKIEITSIVLYGYPEPVIVEPSDTLELVGNGDLYSYAYQDEMGSEVVLDTGASSIAFNGASITLADNKEVDGELVYAYAGVGFGNWKDAAFPQTENVKRISITYKATADFAFGVKESDVAYTMGLAASDEFVTVEYGVGDLVNADGATGVNMANVDQLDLALFGARSGTIEVSSIKFIYVGDAVAVETPSAKALVAPVFAGMVNGKMNIGVPANGRYGITMYSLKGQKLGQVSVDLKAGMNAVPMSNVAFGRQMMIVQIAGNGINAVHKVMVK